MVKTTLEQLGKQLRSHGIRFLSKHLALLEPRATTSAGKPVSILRVILRPSFREFLVICLVLLKLKSLLV